jgi:hypothetical protein
MVPDQADARRREADRRAGEEGGALRADHSTLTRPDDDRADIESMVMARWPQPRGK